MRSLTATIPHAAAAARTERETGTATIRCCGPADLAAVAAMFNRTFRGESGPAPASLEAYLRELFLEHPWQDPELASRVYVQPDGRIGGFIGIMPLRLMLHDRPVRAAQAGSLMVDDPQANPLAGARLLRAFFAGPQELSLSETSNPLSQRMWERLGGEPVPAYSMEWLRVLKPAGFALAFAGNSMPPVRLLQPLGRVVDRYLDRLDRNPLRLAPLPRGETESFDPDDDELSAVILQLSARHALRPQWDHASLRCFLSHAATKQRHGAMIRRVVRDRRQKLLGCYVYYGRPGGVAYVLQALAQPHATDAVVDHLLAHASEHGCVAVRGRSQPDLQDSLLRRHAIFLHRSSLTMHTRDPALAAALRSGEALVTGLAGESWTRLIGDSFN